MNAEQKREYLLRFHRFQKSRENFFTPKINEALHKQYLQAIPYVYQYGADAVNFITSNNIARVIRNLYMDAGIVYGKKIRADLNKIKNGIEIKAGQLGFSERVAKLIAEYFEEDIFNSSNNITQTTRDLIKDLFTKAYSQGLSIDDIVDQLKDTELSKVRARLIARTETVTAANQAAHFVAKESGLNLNKTWLSARDSRVRRHHLAVNGHTVGIDDYFVVGGYEMLQPGDHGGKNGKPVVSGDEIINCRCSTVFRVAESVRAKPIPVKPIPEVAKVFEPAKTIQEAEEFALDTIGVKYANFKGIHLDIANDINRSVFNIKKIMPKIRTNGIGSAQQANRDLKKEVIEAYKKGSFYTDLIKNGRQDLADRSAQRFANRTVSNVGTNTIAWSQTKRVINIPGGEKLDVSKYAGVFVSDKYGKSKVEMDKMVKKNRDKKWFTESAEDFGYIMSHELGHEIDATIGFNNNQDFISIFNREHKKGINNLIDNLSVYGATAGGKASGRKVEMIAEAWAEFVTSKNPRPLAKEIGELMLRTYHTDHLQGTGVRYSEWVAEVMKIVQR